MDVPSTSIYMPRAGWLDGRLCGPHETGGKHSNASRPVFACLRTGGWVVGGCRSFFNVENVLFGPMEAR